MFMGLDSESYDRQYSDAYLAKRILSYFTQYKRYLFVIIAGFTTLAIVVSLRPVLIAAGIDALEEGRDIVPFVLSALLIIAVLQYASNWIRRRLLSRVVGNIVSQLRKDAFAASVDRDLAFYDTHKTGKIVSRITSDTQEFGDVVMFSSDVIAQVISVIFLAAILFSRSVPLTLVVLAMTPFIMVVALSFRRIARDVTRQGARPMPTVNDSIQESVTGISVAKNFRKEAMIYDEFVEVNNRSFYINMRRGFVLSLVFPVLNVLFGVAVAVILYAGAQVVIAGTILVGEWYLFVQGMNNFLFPFINLAAFWSQFQQGLSAAERVFALIDADNTIIQHDNQPAGVLTGAIKFQNAAFEYTPGQPILRNFNLEIKTYDHQDKIKSITASRLDRYGGDDADEDDENSYGFVDLTPDDLAQPGFIGDTMTLESSHVLASSHRSERTYSNDKGYFTIAEVVQAI
ncbi:MAG: ABC transporter ATP-binding protein, partial [Fuerstiella sp.]|nr:ABC transporter ATP-binding protein [Fuerstiella sp.]